MTAPQATSSRMHREVELKEMGPEDEITEIEISEPLRARREPLSIRWQKIQFFLRMVVLTVTAFAATYVAVVELLLLVWGSSNRNPSLYLNGYPQLISHYVLSLCGLFLSALVIVFELDFQFFPSTLVYSQIKLLQFYAARGVVQIFLAAIVYSQQVNSSLRWLWVMKDIGALAMALVGLFHFFFGICCLDRIVLGLRTTKHNQYRRPKN